MMRSFFSRGVLTLLIIMSISTCRSPEDDPPSTIKESTALGSTLTFSPVGIREASTDSRCMSTMASFNPEWDDRDLRHMCSWGADVSCLACWASKHPNARPSHILDNCLPDENGDDSDIQGNGCYNGPGPDYDGPDSNDDTPNDPDSDFPDDVTGGGGDSWGGNQERCVSGRSCSDYNRSSKVCHLWEEYTTCGRNCKTRKICSDYNSSSKTCHLWIVEASCQ